MKHFAEQMTTRAVQAAALEQALRAQRRALPNGLTSGTASGVGRVAELLAGAMHYCRSERIDFAFVLQQAEAIYRGDDEEAAIAHAAHRRPSRL